MGNTKDVDGLGIIERLAGAINAHDPDGVADCFDDEVESVQPAHPARTFRGREQVRRNWAQILGGVPDLRATLVRCVAEGDGAWSEWHWTGTRGDGQPFEMRGVTIQRFRGDVIASVRFYMEPVDGGGPDVAGAIRGAVGR